MSTAMGLLLGVGLLLVASPVLWPLPDRDTPRRSRSGDWARNRMAEAGLPQVSVTVLVSLSLICGAASAALAFAVAPVVALAAGAGAAGTTLPMLVISRRAGSRRRTTRVVWPDVIDHLISAVRSGVALPESLVMVGHSGPSTVKGAFAQFEHAYRSGANFGVCLDRLKLRLADPTADRILETLRMAREVGGGQLVTVLTALSASLRQEAGIRSELEARQSWVVNAARLGVSAPWLVLMLLSTRPEAAAAYNSPTGIVLIAAGLAVSAVAYRVMLRIGRLPEERRWSQ